MDEIDYDTCVKCLYDVPHTDADGLCFDCAHPNLVKIDLDENGFYRAMARGHMIRKGHALDVYKDIRNEWYAELVYKCCEAERENAK